jgi:hypothetical protein
MQGNVAVVNIQLVDVSSVAFESGLTLWPLHRRAPQHINVPLSLPSLLLPPLF